MADSQIEEVKNRLNILDVIGSYMKLTKTGINYRGVCPFHSEKKPSFFVNPARQIWHCFGCGKGFSMFDFVMAIEGIEFGDALRILANKAGVELKRENVQLRTERQRLYEICELATAFFEKQLEASAAGREVQDYLLKRGITRDSIKKWRLGYSPDTWNGLSDFLVSQGYNREEIVKAGLSIEKENDKTDSYDRFRGRIIFPIFDLNSQVIGFGGRVFKQSSGEIAKYINTPQTLLYDKSGILYGLNNAKLAVRKQNQCVVTEGYTDVIMCHQAGFENTVAASGTALTWQHLNILKRYSENLVLAFDADIAGDSATKRGINTAQVQGFNIKIAEAHIKEADPADIILKDPNLWQESVSKARSIMDYYFDSAFSVFDKNAPEGKKEISRITLPAIKRLANKIEQSHWVQKLSQMLGTREEAVMEELAKVKPERYFQENKSKEEQPSFIQPSEDQRKKLIEEKIISLILRNPGYIKLIEESQYLFFSEKVRKFLEELRKIIDLSPDSLEIEEKNLDFNKILDGVMSDDDDFRNFLAALELKGEIDIGEDNEQEFKLCLLELKNLELKNKLNKISDDIKKAEVKKDSASVNSLIEEFNKLTKEL